MLLHIYNCEQQRKMKNQWVQKPEMAARYKDPKARSVLNEVYVFPSTHKFISN